MDKTYRTEFFRLFLVEALPAPLSPASAHIQIFDNYIRDTRIRLRSIRVPETKEWTRSLQQRFPAKTAGLVTWKTAELHLNESEYAHFQIFEGNEVRKNRYFHEFDSRMFMFDIYLGTLWGLIRARVEFQCAEELLSFQPPPFAVFEVTQDEFFDDSNLVYRNFEDVRSAVEKMDPLKDPAPDE